MTQDFVQLNRNPHDLQRLALNKLEDLQHDLLHSDFRQGPVLASLRKEVDVQNWMADRLRRDQGRTCSIEREPHVAEEKEPDIRFRAKASDANVPMEIKIPECLSLRKLENALTKQLISRYLRDMKYRFGILLLVHKQTRPKVGEQRTANGSASLRWLSI